MRIFCWNIQLLTQNYRNFKIMKIWQKQFTCEMLPCVCGAEPAAWLRMFGMLSCSWSLSSSILSCSWLLLYSSLSCSWLLSCSWSPSGWWNWKTCWLCFLVMRCTWFIGLLCRVFDWKMIYDEKVDQSVILTHLLKILILEIFSFETISQICVLLLEWPKVTAWAIVSVTIIFSYLIELSVNSALKQSKTSNHCWWYSLIVVTHIWGICLSPLKDLLNKLLAEESSEKKSVTNK